MSVVIELEPSGAARVRGEAPVRPAPQPRTPANNGSGDVRKKTVPVIKMPDTPSAAEWENGAYSNIQQWLEQPQQGGGVLLQPADDPRALAGKLDHAGLVAVDFPKFSDGRGYSIATQLRRLGYSGPLRAIGQVTADQIYMLARVGFNSFALRDDQDPDVALAALNSFSVAYQGGIAGPNTGALQHRAEAAAQARVRLLERALTAIAKRHERPGFATSMQAEDMVITDVIARLRLPIDVFTLDTGRLHQETVDLIEQTRKHYDLDIKVYRPNEAVASAHVGVLGANSFYDGVPQRKLCCAIRKVEPLGRALEGRDAWITGQRRDQAVTRGTLAEVEADVERGMQKYNPLALWTWDDVTDYAKRFAIPVNPLYARGYLSIGCEPCTRALKPGEDPRAGRWWWENADTKECGLHVSAGEGI